jgi:hypothetical protein
MQEEKLLFETQVAALEQAKLMCKYIFILPLGLLRQNLNNVNPNTVMIRKPDKSGIQLVDLCPVFEWSDIRTASEYQTN